MFYSREFVFLRTVLKTFRKVVRSNVIKTFLNDVIKHFKTWVWIWHKYKPFKIGLKTFQKCSLVNISFKENERTKKLFEIHKKYFEKNIATKLGVDRLVFTGNDNKYREKMGAIPND